MRVVVLGLAAHPATPSRAIERIEVRAERISGGRMKLVYTLSGRMDGVRVPPPRRPAFADELWRHTCCEAFVAARNGYDEFNFSPSGEFAAYRFAGYRDGMSRLDAEVTVAWSDARLEASIPLREGALKIALSAVVEEADGTLSYWALRHAPGKPDFHHADAFALRLDEIRH